MTIRELQILSDDLRRKLGSMRDENVGLKYRLSEVLKHHFNQPMLLEVENFQSYFLQEDQLILLLRNDIAVLNRQLRLSLDEAMIAFLHVKLAGLQKDIDLAEKQFDTLKADFASYLQRNNLAVKD